MHRHFLFLPRPFVERTVCLGVQALFNAVIDRSIFVQTRNRVALHDKNAQKSWERVLCQSGRIGKVGPPASSRSFFTFPYSHLAALNGNPALRGQRHAPRGLRHG
jgi:hypothetical protein